MITPKKDGGTSSPSNDQSASVTPRLVRDDGQVSPRSQLNIPDYTEFGTELHSTDEERKTNDATQARASARLAQIVDFKPNSYEYLQDEINTMSREMSGDLRLEPVTVVIASSLVASVGYVIWAQRSLYLLASLLTATPLWKEFDTLAVLEFHKAKSGKRRRGNWRQDVGDEDRGTLQSILERVK
jgi:peptidoglycan hydrolase-like protein with peptidoglycan-binding domain